MTPFYYLSSSFSRENEAKSEKVVVVLVVDYASFSLSPSDTCLYCPEDVLSITQFTHANCLLVFLTRKIDDST